MVTILLVERAGTTLIHIISYFLNKISKITKRPSEDLRKEFAQWEVLRLQTVVKYGMIDGGVGGVQTRDIAKWGCVGKKECYSTTHRTTNIACVRSCPPHDPPQI